MSKDIFVSQEKAGIGMGALFNSIKRGEKAALHIDTPAIAIVEKMLGKNAPNSWEEYCNCDPHDIASALILQGITEYADIEAFFKYNGGGLDIDAIYQEILAIINNPETPDIEI